MNGLFISDQSMTLLASMRKSSLTANRHEMAI